MPTVNAVVFTAVNCVEIQPVEIADPAPGEVRVRTLYSTISSGTEGWILANLFTWAPTQYPCVPGYERVGVVEAVGEGVENLRVGQKVFATVSNLTGTVKAQSGSHMAAANTRAGEIYALPDGVDDVGVSGLVVAQVGYNAASRVTMQPGDWVVVYGDGLIGQFAAQAARARGARVILVGHRPERLRLAEQHSADVVVNNHAENAVEAVRAHAGSPYVTAILDSVQTEAAQSEYMPLLERARGQVVYCGFTPGTTWADMGWLQRSELTVHFISGWTRARMEATLDLVARAQMRLRPLVTHLVPYTRAPEMYALNREKAPGVLGITLDWTS